VVGSGISGIAAAYSLSTAHKVTLIEKQNRLGGHSNSISVDDGNGYEVKIDTGFIVFNDKNYPRFTRFLRDLDIESVKSDMSFSYVESSTGLQYAGTLAGLLYSGGLKNSVARWRLLASIYKWSRELDSQRRACSFGSNTIYEALIDLGCPTETINKYFIPMASAIWSCDQGESKNIPAATFIKFFSNHGLLNIFDRPKWFTVKDGSQSYIRKFEEIFQGKIIRNSGVYLIRECDSGILVKSRGVDDQIYDMVVIATHADEATELLDSNLILQKTILSTYSYSVNQVFLHTDTNLMPSSRKMWASWNVLGNNFKDSQEPFVTYNMNRLQGIESKNSYLVTLSSSIEPDQNKLIYQTTYSHPILNHDENKNDKNFDVLNRSGNIKFCGSYLGYGFHEDGFLSGLRVSNLINGEVGY